MLSPGSDQDLLRALRAGDTTACDLLYDYIRERALPLLRLAPGIDPEEVLADTASTVWLSIKALRDDRKLLAFVTTIARRIVWRRREEARRFNSLPEESRLPPQPPLEHSNLEREETLNRIAGSLRRSDQILFQLLYVMGADNAEVQKALSVAPEIVRKRKHRLNLRLRDAVNQKSDGPGKS